MTRRKTRETGLGEAEILLRAAMSAAPDLIFLLDPEGCFRFLNDRVEEFLGYEIVELIDSHYSKLIVADDLDRAGELFRGPVGNAVRRAQLRFEPKPGVRGEQPVWLEVAVARVNGTGGLPAPDGISGVCVIARDTLAGGQPGSARDLPMNRDPLTGLANRIFFEQCLSTALKKRRRGDDKLAVMFIDLDGFKTINDSLGHAGGDRLLRAVAGRLRASLRPGDTLARFGGDEFTLFLADIHVRADAGTVADKIIRQFEAPFVLEGNEVHIGASVGIALHPGAGDTVDVLLDNADSAMYRAKRAGRACEFYDY